MKHATLGDLIDLKKGKKPPSTSTENLEGHLPVILTPQLRGKEYDSFCLPFKGQVTSKYTDVIVSWDGSIGQASSGLVGVVGSTLGILQIKDPSKLSAQFLYHFITSHADELKRNSKGASIPHLNPEYLKSMKINLPSLEEQRLLVNVLDGADATLLKLTKFKERIQELKTSLYDGVAKESVASRPLSEIAQIWDCSHTTPKWKPEGKVCLRTTNLSRGGWNWEDTRYVDIEQFDGRSKGGGAKAGDIILSREGTVGIAAIVQPGMEICLGQRLVQVRVTSSDCDPQFLLAHLLEVLQPEKISQQLVGSTAKHLNVADLRKLKTPIVAESQRAKFASLLVQIESLEQKVSRAILISNELYAARAYEAFG